MVASASEPAGASHVIAVKSICRSCVVSTDEADFHVSDVELQLINSLPLQYHVVHQLLMSLDDHAMQVNLT